MKRTAIIIALVALADCASHQPTPTPTVSTGPGPITASDSWAHPNLK